MWVYDYETLYNRRVKIAENVQGRTTEATWLVISPCNVTGIETT